MQPGKGWSSAGRAQWAGQSLPTPIREVTLHVAVESEEGGVLLTVSSDDPLIWCDDWFPSQRDAEWAAAEWYGVRPEDWRTA